MHFPLVARGSRQLKLRVLHRVIFTLGSSCLFLCLLSQSFHFPLQFYLHSALHLCQVNRREKLTTSVPQQERLFGPLAESNTPTGYEPNDLVELDNMEKFLNRSVMTSACDSAESIATPPLESDLDDEQIQVMLASPQYLQEREASADQHRVYHSCRENSVSSSSRFETSAGRPAALFSNKRKSRQDFHSDRNGTFLMHQQAQGENYTLPRFSGSESDQSASCRGKIRTIEA